MVRIVHNLHLNGVKQILFLNLSLEAKLTDQGISLPLLENPDEKTEIDDYFHAVGDVVSIYSNWQVIPRYVPGFLQFYEICYV